MICPNCSHETPADAAFCPKCGSKLATSAEAAHSTEPAAQTPVERLRASQAATAAHAEPEHDLWRGGYSPKAMYGSWLGAALLTLAVVVLAILVPNPVAWIVAAAVVPLIWLSLLLVLVYRKLSVEYTLTSQRFLHPHGILRRVANQILLVDIDDVAYEQDFIQRFLNVGTITLRSTDASDPVLPMPGIDDVQRVANLIDSARREERRKRAIYMANV
jgi:hypothetical protein